MSEQSPVPESSLSASTASRRTHQIEGSEGAQGGDRTDATGALGESETAVHRSQQPSGRSVLARRVTSSSSPVNAVARTASTSPTATASTAAEAQPVEAAGSHVDSEAAPEEEEVDIGDGEHAIELPPAKQQKVAAGGSGGGTAAGAPPKDRHSKVQTHLGLRDRRVRLSVPAALKFYEIQYRLRTPHPSAAIEWLILQAQAAIRELPELPHVSGLGAVSASEQYSRTVMPPETGTQHEMPGIGSALASWTPGHSAYPGYSPQHYGAEREYSHRRQSERSPLPAGALLPQHHSPGRYQYRGLAGHGPANPPYHMPDTAHSSREGGAALDLPPAHLYERGASPFSTLEYGGLTDDRSQARARARNRARARTVAKGEGGEGRAATSISPPPAGGRSSSPGGLYHSSVLPGTGELLQSGSGRMGRYEQGHLAAAELGPVSRRHRRGEDPYALMSDSLYGLPSSSPSFLPAGQSSQGRYDVQVAQLPLPPMSSLMNLPMGRAYPTPGSTQGAYYSTMHPSYYPSSQSYPTQPSPSLHSEHPINYPPSLLPYSPPGIGQDLPPSHSGHPSPTPPGSDMGGYYLQRQHGQRAYPLSRRHMRLAEGGPHLDELQDPSRYLPPLRAAPGSDEGQPDSPPLPHVQERGGASQGRGYSGVGALYEDLEQGQGGPQSEFKPQGSHESQKKRERHPHMGGY